MKHSPEAMVYVCVYIYIHIHIYTYWDHATVTVVFFFDGDRLATENSWGVCYRADLKLEEDGTRYGMRKWTELHWIIKTQKVGRLQLLYGFV